MPVFWLILIIGGGAPMMHVGTFLSLENCEAAAGRDVFVDRTPRNPTQPPPPPEAHFYVCVQANQAGTNPPSVQPIPPN